MMLGEGRIIPVKSSIPIPALNWKVRSLTNMPFPDGSWKNLLSFVWATGRKPAAAPPGWHD